MTDDTTTTRRETERTQSRPNGTHRQEHRVSRRRFLATTGVTSMAGFAGCFGDSDDPAETDDTDTDSPNDTGTDPPNGPDTDSPDGPEPSFRVGEQYLEVDTEGDGSYEQLLVRGVNLGMAKPGHFPGEAAITREEYDRWFAALGELHANVVRTYTIHPPAFYEALAAHNRQADDPLYLLQGTWIGEHRLLEAGDVTQLTEEFQEEIRRSVDVIYGEATLPDRPGHASGAYTTDASRYLLGHVIGIEWPPTAVMTTNEHAPATEYSGRFLESSGSPFENWLAENLDMLIEYEDETYNRQRPVAFTNWVTTDPLSHPYEPFDLEDAVSLDPDTIQPTGAFDAGTFAAYHVYPYYPDFLNHTPEYVEYTDHRGEANSYAGYLDDLVGATAQPLVVAEFGVPTSRGIAHHHVHGRHQGGHTEREQGEFVAAMYEDIVEAGAAGGVLFVWQDEWFKRTWNLQALSEPSRRPFWSNVQTPEQRFGLLAFEPVDAPLLDGSERGWGDAHRLRPATPPHRLGDSGGEQRELVGVDVTHDLAALSLRVELASIPGQVDWSAVNVLLWVGVTGEGNTTLPLGTDARVPPTDFLVRLAGPGDSRLQVDAHYDAFARQYGGGAGLDLDSYREPDSGRFTPSRMVTNHGYTVPPTGEQVPFESVETGRLRYGVGNPDDPAYDSLADVHVAPDSNTIEVRLPWLLLNVADPSSRLRLGPLWEGEISAWEPFEEISIGAATYAPDSGGQARELDSTTNLTHAVPGIDGDELSMDGYTWETWNEPTYRERRKQSYTILRERFGEYVE